MNHLKYVTFFLVFLLCSFVPKALAQEEPWNYWLLFLPPRGAITLNQEGVSNKDNDRGKVMALNNRELSIAVPSIALGVKIRDRHFEALLNRDTTVSLHRFLTLESGSLSVKSRKENQEETVLMMKDLLVRFTHAEFLVYISGDQTEYLVKVLSGEVSFENSKRDVKTVIPAGMTSSADQAGRLLIPYTSEEDKKEKRWFQNQAFFYPYRPIPIAHAGEDQRVLGNIQVVLDGSASDFSTGDIFEWTLKSGPEDDSGKPITEVPFDSTNIVKPLFTPRVDGEYRFSLQISTSSGEKSNMDEVTIFVGKRYLKPIWIYPDVPPTHPNNLAITYLYKKNVMKGSEDKKTGKILFRPDDTLNRVEILKAVLENKRQKLMSLEDLKATQDIFFYDVKPEHWFAPYVYTAKKLGLIEGSEGIYRPGENVLLSEAIKIVVKSFQASLEGLSKVQETPYPDVDAQSWFFPYFVFVKKYNLVDADPNGNVYPERPITRAQFAEMVYRMESINLGEKRGFLLGKLKKVKTNQGIAQAEIYIYKAIEPMAKSPLRTTGFIEKGDLYYKTLTKNDGTFTVSLPIGTKFFIEAISGDTISSKSIVAEVFEDSPVRIELEMMIRE